MTSTKHNLPRRLAAIATAGILISGCAAADKNAPASSSSSGASSSGSSSMAGMKMGGSSSSSVNAAVPSVNGIKPVPDPAAGLGQLGGDERSGRWP